MKVFRRHVYSEHKSGPVGSSERTGAWAGVPIRALEHLEDFRVSRWSPPPTFSSATLVGTAGSGANGWTFTNIGTPTSPGLSVLDSGAIALTSGTAAATGLNLQYSSSTDCYYGMAGAWSGGLLSVTAGNGASIVFNFRVGISQASGTFASGAAVVCGYWATDTSLLTTAGASDISASGWGFYMNSTGVYAVSGSSGQNSTLVGTVPTPGATSTGLNSTFNNYSIRVEKATGSANLEAIYFYVNNTLKATHTTTLPASTVSANLSLAATTPDTTAVIAHFDDISFAATRPGYTN